jgi:hypothetical protein
MLPTPLPQVIFQRIDDGAVLFDPRAEIYFGLNEVGAKVWQLLDQSSSVETLCERLGADYPNVPGDTIRADVVELLAQLASEGLVAPRVAAQSDALPTP